MITVVALGLALGISKPEWQQYFTWGFTTREINFPGDYFTLPNASKVKVAGVEVGRIDSVKQRDDGTATYTVRVQSDIIDKVGSAPSANVRPDLAARRYRLRRHHPGWRPHPAVGRPHPDRPGASARRAQPGRPGDPARRGQGHPGHDQRARGHAQQRWRRRHQEPGQGGTRRPRSRCRRHQRPHRPEPGHRPAQRGQRPAADDRGPRPQGRADRGGAARPAHHLLGVRAEQQAHGARHPEVPGHARHGPGGPRPPVDHSRQAPGHGSGGPADGPRARPPAPAPRPGAGAGPPGGQQPALRAAGDPPAGAGARARRPRPALHLPIARPLARPRPRPGGRRPRERLQP